MRHAAGRFQNKCENKGKKPAIGLEQNKKLKHKATKKKQNKFIYLPYQNMYYNMKKLNFEVLHLKCTFLVCVCVCVV